MMLNIISITIPTVAMACYLTFQYIYIAFLYQGNMFQKEQTERFGEDCAITCGK